VERKAPKSRKKNGSIVPCYLALFDILGFKQIIESQPLNAASRSLDNLERIVNDLRGRKGIESPNHLEVRWFQDTLIITASGNTNRHLASIIMYCSALLAFTFSEGIFLRGTITHGELYITATAALGKPIVRAYAMEQNQEWVGCWLDLECVKAANEEAKRWLGESDMIFPYGVPFKNGAVRPEFVLNWPLCLISECGLKALRSGWDKFALEGLHSWEVLRKVHNTDAFLQFLVAEKWRPKPHPRSSDSIVKPHWLANHDLYSLLENYREDNPAWPNSEKEKNNSRE
jgi:hypothetical protein